MVWLGDAEANTHWSNVVDQFEPLVAPREVTKLIEWRNEYVAGIRSIYKRRRKLGVHLAFTGRSKGVPPDSATAAAAVTAGGVSLPLSPRSSASGSGPTALTPIQAVGGGVDVITSFVDQCNMFTDTLSILEALKQNVAEELAFESEKMMEIISVQARMSAHIVILSYPLLPDPLAMATELMRRQNLTSYRRAVHHT
mmetsp:Transcript_4213/g.10294  ORF Transcript_4213/g.10294 Transcript_4213/m.10294 type:complete len:197 (-) Transcript_4213:469-1059(-)